MRKILSRISIFGVVFLMMIDPASSQRFSGFPSAITQYSPMSFAQEALAPESGTAQRTFLAHTPNIWAARQLVGNTTRRLRFRTAIGVLSTLMAFFPQPSAAQSIEQPDQEQKSEPGTISVKELTGPLSDEKREEFLRDLEKVSAKLREKNVRDERKLKDSARYLMQQLHRAGMSKEDLMKRVVHLPTHLLKDWEWNEPQITVPSVELHLIAGAA